MTGSTFGVDRDELSALLNAASPFGPASADEFDSRGAAKILYDKNNEIDQVLRRTAPVFLIGRRGSGKTAFLRAAMTNEELAVDLNSPELITQVAQTLQALRLHESGQFVERVAPVWSACFIAALCSRIWSKHCRLREVDCPEAFAFGFRRTASLDGRGTDAAVQFLLEMRQSASSGDFASINTLADEVQLNGIPLWAARQSLQQAAATADFHAIISLDSLDRYKNIFYEGGILVSEEAIALQGLFRAASRAGRDASSLFKVRVSFPAELWHYYSELSSNPLKDFDNSIVLHWDSRELLSIAARRFLKYLEIAQPIQYRQVRVEQSGSQRGQWAQALFLNYLPRILENGMGTREPTISYLLRHTQLLPRHLIHILNKVFADKDIEPGAISADDLRKGVLAAEVEITAAVLDAFSIPYPHLTEVCNNVIPRLPLVFSESELHKVVNTSSVSGMDYRDVVNMLVEVGAVGRRTETTSVYVKADFEYLHANRMLITSDDQLCLHPLFSKRFDSKALRKPVAPEVLPVYPLGSDPLVDEFSRVIHMRGEGEY